MIHIPQAEQKRNRTGILTEQERNKSGTITIIIKIINIIKTIIIINPEAQIHIALLMLKLLKIRYMRDTEKRHCKIGKTVDIFE